MKDHQDQIIQVLITSVKVAHNKITHGIKPNCWTTMKNKTKGKITQAVITQGKITQYDYPCYYTPVSNYIQKDYPW